MRQMLISWTATSCFLILAVVALRAAFGKRMGAGLRYALWGLVLLRLLVPVQLFTSPVIGTVIDREKIVTRSEREVLDALGGQDGPQVVVSAAPAFPEAPNLPDPPEPPAAPDLTKAPSWLGWIWLGGSVFMALVLAGCNLRFWLRLRRTRRAVGGADVWAAEGGGPHMSQQMPSKVGAAPLGGPACNTQSAGPHDRDSLPLYTTAGLPSPCLFGVLRPAVYVSPETAADPDALRHVLAHEGTHYRHGDHIWSLLRCAALCVHWWNPLVWLAARLSRRDGELACDEGALKRLGDGERAAYGRTLLALVTAKPAPGGLLTCSTAMTGDKKSLKERFSRIARAPKRVVGFAVAAVLLGLLVTVCAFGQKAEDAAPWEELEADLSLTVEEDGTVRITGTVDGTELPRGTAWWPDREKLYVSYPPFDSGIKGFFEAQWADENHTAVNISTVMMHLLSSYAPTGHWEFTVDLSGARAKVTKMEAVAGTSSSGEEVRMYPEAISDEEAIRVGRIAAKLLTAAEECWEDWTENGNVPVDTPEPSEPPAPSETPPAGARAELKAALLGEAAFTFYDKEGKPASLDIGSTPQTVFPLTGEYGEIWSFAVIDLDGDGAEEVVLDIGGVAGDAGGYLVLRWAGPEDVRGYSSYWRNFWDLKTDGTFYYDYYMGITGLARVSFPAPGYAMEQHALAEGREDMSAHTDPPTGTFTVDGAPVTLEEYLAALDKQDEKPDAEWYEFTEENVKKALG